MEGPTSGMQCVITNTFHSIKAMKSLNHNFSETPPFINKQSLQLLPLSPLMTPAIQANLGSMCGVQGLRSARERCGFLVTGFLGMVDLTERFSRNHFNRRPGNPLRCWDAHVVNEASWTGSLQFSLVQRLNFKYRTQNQTTSLVQLDQLRTFF